MEITEDTIKRAPILVVDDSVMSLREMERLLENEGYKSVKTLQDPEEVVATYRQEKPALIILDYHMPVMNGEDVLDALNAEFPKQRITVLFWTSASEDDLYTRALKKGARDVLRKENVRREEVLTRVRNSVESHLYSRQLKQQNEKLNQKVRRRTRQLEETSLETIGRLAQAAEFRDNETGEHIQRIGLLAAKLASQLGIDDTICEAIRYAAPMHDVGKIGVSDEILFKNGALTADEWNEMESHTIFGARILSGSDQHYLKLAKNIALYHHEKWNGQGYPEGLSGGQIPVEARITAVCDVFDAVLSDRPYKDPWPEDQAIQLIRDERGEHFDPEIADCFLDNVDSLLSVREEVDETSSPEETVFSKTSVA